jgi:hypothetical protein
MIAVEKDSMVPRLPLTVNFVELLLVVKALMENGSILSAESHSSVGQLD